MFLRKSRIIRIAFDSLAPFALAWALSVWISSSGLDLAWQHAAFDADTGTWAAGDRWLWRALYDFGTYPVIVVGALAVVALAAGYRGGWWRQWRRVALFALSLLAIGSGLITNLWLKETWGRPRPREVEEFGGRQPFEDVFSMDLTGAGKSFPCGHATAGFFFIGLWFLLRRSRPGMAAIALAASLAWGGLIGYARMLQGGHFGSDVVWAAGVMWITAALLFYAFGLDRSIRDRVAECGGSGRIPLWVKAGGSLGVAAVVGSVLLATPYQARRDIHPLEPGAADATARGSIKVWLGDIDVTPGPSFRISGQAYGHGVPTSEIADRWEESIDPDGIWRFKYHQRLSGRFTEVAQTLAATIPWTRVDFLKWDLGPGRTRMHLPNVDAEVKIELVLREADLIVLLDPGVSVRLEGDGAQPFAAVDGTDVQSGAEPVDGESSLDYRIVVTGRTGGTIRFEAAPPKNDMAPRGEM